jgi:Methyl-accepting chemotaxis protein (MCP) signalling domain
MRPPGYRSARSGPGGSGRTQVVSRGVRLRFAGAVGVGGVAAQTRLLALDATIEADGADEGFAVVASEVEDLADQMAQATERVTSQVQTIRQACRGGRRGHGHGRLHGR